jgi:hypothetical protein
VGGVMPGGNDFYFVLGRKLIEAIEWVGWSGDMIYEGTGRGDGCKVEVG